MDFKSLSIILIVLVSSLLEVASQGLPCLLNNELCYNLEKYKPLYSEGIEKKKEFNQLIPVLQTPISFDVNNDCNPELIIVGNYHTDWTASNQILVLNSSTLQEEFFFNTFYFFTYTNSFIFFKYNEVIEIIVAVADIPINPSHVRGRLVCYNYDNSIKWISDQTYSGGTGIEGSPSLADFNQDGIPEIYIDNRIFNANTGVLLVNGGNNGVGSGGIVTNSVAANLDDDPNDLELAAGYTVYKVVLNNLTGTTGNIIISNNILIDGIARDGLTAVADINNDGKLDVIVLSSQGFHSLIYVYTYVNNRYEILSKKEWMFYKPFSLMSIGKLNKQEENGLLVSSTYTLIKYSYNNTNILNEEWRIPHTDGSAFIGISLFDFDNDGIKEIVFRDETEIKIYSVKNDTAVLLGQHPCISRTSFEKPIIVDIDGSGNTTICVTCADNVNDLYGRLTLFGPPEGQKWAPARPIWHQYAYNPLMINDDGTVPQYMQNPATYKNGKYNNFMAQANILDEDGRYPVPAASLYGDITCVRYDIDTETYSVDFTLHNRSDASKSAVSGVPVSFYDGDPLSGGSLLGTINTMQDIAAGQTSATMTFTWTSGTPIDRIFMVVNTDKSTLTMDEDADFFTEECDYTDNISQKMLPQIQLQTEEICGNESYEFYGQIVSTTGIYHHKIPSDNGCDSLIYGLELEVTTVKNTRVETQSCDSYTWNNQTYTDTGEYVFATQSANGCDSIVTLDLKIYPSQNTALAQTACDTYIWNGQTYTSSGVYDYQTETIHGCDSTVILDLRIHPSYDLSASISACEDYIWQGNTYTESGRYTFATQTAQGCDSLMTLDLTITDVLRTTESVTTCDTYRWNGADYTTDGQYEYSTLSSLGCDSIVTLDLRIYPSQSTALSLTTCDSVTYNNQILKEAGQYIFSLETVQGCDSIVTLDLAIPTQIITETHEDCDNYRWSLSGQTYDTSGVYALTFTNIWGCDSTYQLWLTLHPSYDVKMVAERCGSYLWTDQGQTYYESGTYVLPLKTAQGCDSLLTLDLKIHPEYAYRDTIITEEAYTWPINQNTYNESGQYLSEYTTENACDSIYHLYLTIRRAETGLYFPNIFRPNGPNGYFTVFTNDTESTIKRLRIYDRWGGLMFQRENFVPNDPELGWNGTFDGRPVVPGVYVWMITMEDKDGKEKVYTGDVTVVR